MQTLNSNPEMQSYDPILFAHLAVVEDKHFWFRTRNQVIRALIQQIIPKFSPGYWVLEVGCGTGNVLRELSKTCLQGLVVGIDLYFGGLKFARDRVTSPLVQADLHAMPFEARFNLIGLFDVIEHIPNDEEILEHLKSMIVPGGYLFLTVPAHPSLWSYFDEGSHHCRRYKRAELERKLKSAGFKIDFVTYYMALIFPLVWLARKLNEVINGNKSLSIEQATSLTLTEFKITPLVNPLLTWLLGWETKILARRHKLPFGTSLLALAQKPAD
jgi:2-polyprenyl-3-methyl-5-hydroxy-6-metoxy-1,4-benzoquinol methylase